MSSPSNIAEQTSALRARAGGGAVEGLCKRLLHRLLGEIRHGVIEVREHSSADGAGEVRRYGELTAVCELRAVLSVHSPKFYRAAILGGSVGGGASYVRGEWDADDLTTLIRILAVNREAMNRREAWRERALAPLVTATRWLRANTPMRARRRIAAHYDLGNDFYALFLDRDMVYSAAVFENPDQDLEQAQQAKLARICAKLDLQPEDHLLEIGTGWGGLAIHAARHYGCRVTTTTISAEQFRLATEKVRASGLEDRVTVLADDYRSLTGEYDKLVSVEMIEAIGHRQHATFFRHCARLLKPHGLALVQSITLSEQRHDAAMHGEDFIQRYVFPGGSLPSVSRMTGMIKRHTDMQLLHLEDFGTHYAQTLAHWRRRFRAALPQVRALGYPPAFERLWEFYLAYCEGGFTERTIGVAQLLMSKPLARPRALMPALHP